MNAINIFRLPFVLLLVLLYSCTKMETRKPLSTGGPKPNIVKDINVVNGKGSATISYTLPADPNIQYVVAEYNVNATTKREAKVSRYGNSITVDGFNNKGEYPISLYTVNSEEVKSDPLVVKVNVDTPAFRIVYKDLLMQEDFGGVSASFTNPTKANIAIAIIVRNKNGEFTPTETFYTASDSGRFSARGFDTTKRVFGIYVRDQFNNYSDTLFKTMSPFEEQMLDKGKFQPYVLPTDMPSAYSWVVSNIWDNNLGTGYHSPEPVPLPGHITFDLGVTAKLSRFRLWQREGLYYAWGNPARWAMYGSTNPDPGGSFNGWTQLLLCNSRKPSGSPQGTNTEEDINYIKAGEEFNFPITNPPVRYIRMEFYESWSSSPRIHFMEVTFWGTVL